MLLWSVSPWMGKEHRFVLPTTYFAQIFNISESNKSLLLELFCLVLKQDYVMEKVTRVFSLIFY